MAGLRKHVLQTDPIIPAARSGPTVDHEHVANMRAQAVAMYNDLASVGGRPRAAAEVIARGRSLWPELKLSRRTLDRWRMERRERGDLTPRWGRGGRRGTRSNEAWAYFLAMYRSNRPPNVALYHQMTAAVAAARGWAWPASAASTREMLRRHDDLAGTLLTQDPKSFGRKFDPYIEHGEGQLPPGDLFVSDHKRCRFHVRDGVRLIRPWVTFVQDRGSRLIVGWRLSREPNQNTVLASLRQAFIAHCLPRRLRVDNGRDYSARLFHGKTKQQRRALAAHLVGEQRAASITVRERQKVACDRPEWRGLLPELGIDVHFSLPFNPRGKSVERFNRTFDQRFSFLHPGWCGRTNVDRPESDKELYNASVRAREGKPLSREQRERLAAIPTFAETERMIGEWIEREMGRPLAALGGVSPAAYWRANPPDRPVAQIEALDALMQIRGAYEVGANGVTLDVGGARQSYGRDCPALAQFRGRRVLVAIDEQDAGHCLLWEPLAGGDRRLIGAALANDRLPPGATPDQLRVAMAQLQRTRRHYKRFAAAARANRKRLPQLVAEAQAAQRALSASDGQAARATGTCDAAPAAPIRILRTGLEAHLTAAQAAAEAARNAGKPDPEFDRAFRDGAEAAACDNLAHEARQHLRQPFVDIHLIMRDGPPPPYSEAEIPALTETIVDKKMARGRPYFFRRGELQEIADAVLAERRAKSKEQKQCRQRTRKRQTA